jgi:phosphate starvation-inducible PhoH-like protein
MPVSTVSFVPLNEDQKLARALYRTSDVLILSGPAGGGKTHTAVGLALADVLAGKKQRLVLTRPLVECGESLGYLPGGLDEKLAPWLGPISDVLGNLSHAKLATLLGKQVEVVPLAYMRGRTIDHAVAVLDEAQNCTLAQIKMYLTRIGAGGKLILAGDPEQSDIPGRAFSKVIDVLQSLPGVGMVRLDTQCVRHPLIPEILKRLP